ncbi:MAG: glycoside hydrolase family 2 TIM barrel-domain containing protein [Bacteroidota bacterium]
MEKLISLVLCLTTLAIGAQEKITLDGTWNFKIDPYGKGEKEGWYNSDVNFTTWDKMKVPGNWDLINEYADYAGDAWYSRTFEVDKNREEGLIRIVFESVYNDSKVWINGIEVGENHFGLLSFELDISEHLIYQGLNRITVKVNNVFKRGAIWNWGGIRRPVWLEITDKLRLEYQHITAVPDLKKKTAMVRNKVVLTNTNAHEILAKVMVSLEKDGTQITKKSQKVTIPPNTKAYEVNFQFTLPKSKVKLWHYDFPELYQSIVTLEVDDLKPTSITDNFGIRKIEVSGKELLLNGESIRPVGFNLVPEDRVTGNTLPFERIKEDVDMLKELGVNFCRISHLPLPKAYLDYLDKKGIMTFEEVSLWGKDIWVDPDHPMPKEWLHRMVREKYNHPSVVGWSVGNEIGFTRRNPKVMEYVEGAIAMAKNLDPDRLAVYVTDSADKEDTDPVVYSDLIMLNKYGNWGEAAENAWKKHGKPIFFSEYGKELNHEDPNLGIIDASRMLNKMRDKEYILGASLWTFNDYRSIWYGRKGWATPVSQNRAWGIVTTFRQKKRSYYTFKKEYAPVKNLTIETISPNRKTVSVTITPRDKWDIPANPLREFQLRITALNAYQKGGKSSVESLPDIFPGQVPLTTSLSIPQQSPAGFKIELLDPQGYAVYEVVKHFSVPEPPKILYSNTAHDGVRIHFEEAKGAEAYFLRYGINGKVFHSDTTINNFVTLYDKRIDRNEPWSYEVIALNAAGESPPSEKIVLAKDEDELPPIIWNAQRDHEDLVVGFTSSPFDYLYEIQYGFTPTDFSNTVTFRNKGVARIPKMDKDEPIYFRMRCRKQWGFASEWSPKIQVN